MNKKCRAEAGGCYLHNNALLVTQHTWRINAWTALVSPSCCYSVTISHNLAIKLYILKDVGMTNEAAPEPARLVIRPCRPSVHLSGRPCRWTPWKLRGCRLHTIPLPSNHPSIESDTVAHQEWEGNKPGMALIIIITNTSTTYWDSA